ncbi:DUF4190 domain-containing protein [Mycobacterium noviomagense]|uniref:Membrane protein n=1 Tax=Mycobacterium noviomagense TaxID=459858 RepID=A0A7I7P997_9MYCO|nr:DUF4190 domain-containing protein [Mycobacterium noviomagense]ORB18226.1 hypothetical protein BST37_02065 [Mycobacterium noviomagense]BBY05159.1 membrane protein [Mycobacterium noviomagense]
MTDPQQPPSTPWGDEQPRPQNPPPSADAQRPVDYSEYPLPPSLPAPGYPPPHPVEAPGYPVYPGQAVPYGPYRIAPPPGTNGLAIASLVTSLVGVVFCGIPSIVGLILGIIAMQQTKRTGQEGHGLAVAGVIVGGTMTALVVLAAIFVVIPFIAATASP